MELDVIDISDPPQNKPAERRENQNAGTGKISREEYLRRKKRRRRKRLRKQKKRQRRILAGKLLLLALLAALFFFLCFILKRNFSPSRETGNFNRSVFGEEKDGFSTENMEKPAMTEDFLTINPYSRPGEKLPEVKNIFVHYTANPGTSAAQNRSYFENLRLTKETSASAHFVIGYEGEIIQCIPLDEIGYAVKTRNYDSISIECCYENQDGKFSEETYSSLIRLCGWLLQKYNLSPGDVLRHYDEGGKKCPLYFVEHEDAWEKFLSDLEAYGKGEKDL